MTDVLAADQGARRQPLQHPDAQGPDADQHEGHARQHARGARLSACTPPSPVHRSCSPRPLSGLKISGGITTQISRVRASASSRLSGRPSVVSTRTPVISWPNEPAGQRGEQGDLEREDAEHDPARRCCPGASSRRARGCPIVTSVEATQSMTRATIRRGQDAYSGTPRHYPCVARTRRDQPPDPCYMRRNKVDTVVQRPVRRFAWSRSQRSDALTLTTLTRSPARPRRTNVPEQRRAAEVHQGRGRRDGRRPFLRPAGRHAALHRAGLLVRPVGLRRRPRLRRLVDPRLPGDPRVRHVAVPGPDDGVPRPLPRRQDAGRELLHPRPDHRRGLLPRPAQHRAQGDGLPVQHRHRRHGVLRPRGRVLRLRQRPLRDQGRTPASTRSTPRPAPGTPAPRTTTAATRSSTRAATSRWRRTTTSASCATRWSSSSRSPASTSSAPTTRSAPPARPRSTTSSTSCSRPPTT